MSFHLLGFTASLGAAAANTALGAVADAEFSRRGTAGSETYVFTEPYKLLAASHNAASATRARINMPTLNEVCRAQIYPPNRSATIPSNPQIADYRDSPIDLPENEDLGIEASNDAAGAEQTYVFCWIAAPNWTKQIRKGLRRIVVRAQSTASRVANTWGADGALTFPDQTLKGGWYSINGVEVVEATTLAWRINFNRAPMVAGRKLRPGGLATQAIGNIPLDKGITAFGELGVFHTFELPQLGVFSNATGAGAQEVRLDLTYLGGQSRSSPPI